MKLSNKRLRCFRTWPFAVDEQQIPLPSHWFYGDKIKFLKYIIFLITKKEKQKKEDSLLLKWNVECQLDFTMFHKLYRLILIEFHFLLIKRNRNRIVRRNAFMNFNFF